MSNGSIDLRIQAPVAEIVLERAPKSNALAGTMREDLSAAIGTAAADESVHALVVTGAGRAFCAGGDVDTMMRLHANRDDAGFHRILHAGAECVLSLQAFPGLTVAAINGVAAGAGLSLALNCDLRVASSEARFAASWSRIGLVPDWGATFWLPRLIGYAHAVEMTVGGQVLSAPRALELGLVGEVVEPAAVLPRAREIATAAGALGPAAAQARTLLRRGLCSTLESSLAVETEAQEERFASQEVAAALAAFAERRGKPAEPR